MGRPQVIRRLAVQNAGTTEPNAVRDAMSALNTQSFFGQIRFNAYGMNVYKPMGVIQIQGGKTVPVWPKDASEGSLKWPGSAR